MRTGFSDIIIFDLKTERVQEVWRRHVPNSKVKDLVRERQVTLALGYDAMRVTERSCSAGDSIWADTTDIPRK